ncbi:MAG: COX15/CtaA family protein [Actinomycetota bacterium]|nr:COX15/CtaA family protein [Actinomycetota bacterium]
MRIPVISPRAFRRLTLVNVVLLVVIIASGAAVRLTDSGLGCADWPNCNADNFVSLETSESAIEQLNRIFSGLIGVPLAAALFCAYRRRPRRTDLIVRAWLMLALFFANAVVGGVSVMVELAWFSVMGHFLLAIALVGVALDTYRRSGEPEGPREPVVSPAVRRLARAIYALTVWVLVAGTLVTAAGPHGGDIDAKRLEWQISDVARVHSVSVDALVILVLALVFLVVRERAPRPVLLTTSAALGAMTAQGILGYVQYFNAVPEVLVAIHVVGAVVVFGTVQWLQFVLTAPVDTTVVDARSDTDTAHPAAAIATG